MLSYLVDKGNLILETILQYALIIKKDHLESENVVILDEQKQSDRVSFHSLISIVFHRS